MARTKRGTPPSYRRHSSGQACVSVRLPDGRRREILLGAWESPESKAEYARILAELAANQGCLTSKVPGMEASTAPDLTVNEVIVAFWQHAEQHYRREDGTPTGEADNFRDALRPLKALYGHTAARAFGSLALRAVRKEMVKSGLSRGVVNARVNRVRRVFKWAASFELVRPSVYEALRTVAGLQRGRSEARETDAVGRRAGHGQQVQPLALPLLGQQGAGLAAGLDRQGKRLPLGTLEHARDPAVDLAEVGVPQPVAGEQERLVEQ